MQPRNDSGQASIEHVGLVLLIAIVLLAAGGVAAVAAPGFSNRVTTAMQRALCTVTGQECRSLERQPCPLLRTDRTSAGRLTVGVIRLGDDRALLIERRSDGTYVISQVEGIGRGLAVEYGRTGKGATADAMLSARAGRTYAVPDRASAEELVRRLQGKALPGAENILHGAADLVGLERADPNVEDYTLSGRAAASAAVKFGFGRIVDVGGEGEGGAEVGLRIAAHRKEATAFISLDGRVNAFFDALPEIGLRAPARGRGRRGRDTSGDDERSVTGSVKDPLGISKNTEALASGTVALRLAPGPRVLEIEVTGRASAGSSMREWHARLDPDQPAVAAALDEWRRHPVDPSALAALGRAAATSAALDERRFSVTRSDKGYGFEGGDGLGLGLTLDKELRTTRLVSQRSRPVGGIWESRIDCGVAG